MAESRSPVIWSPEATDDIDDLWDYYADVAGRMAADQVLREVGPSQQSTIFPSQDDLATRYEQATQIVFYRLKDDRPEIVRVLDGRRDIDEIFSEGEGG
jgi:toxin ParE1/3/4